MTINRLDNWNYDWVHLCVRAMLSANRWDKMRIGRLREQHLRWWALRFKHSIMSDKVDRFIYSIFQMRYISDKLYIYLIMQNKSTT